MQIKELIKPLQYVKGVGPARANLLHRLNLYTVEDLLFHFPRTYRDYSTLKPIAQLTVGAVETIRGTVKGVYQTRPKPGILITKLIITDGRDLAYGVWFNQPYLKQRFKPGQTVFLTGRVEKFRFEVQLKDPEYEIDDGEEILHTGRIVPVYPSTENLSQKVLRTIIKQALDDYRPYVQEILPQYLLTKYRLMPRQEALTAMHFPPDIITNQQAKRRFVFEELLLIQLGMGLMKKKTARNGNGIAHGADGKLSKAFINLLPFKLTQAQTRVVEEIKRDMERPVPMQRLVQGDVGAGKTIVAAIALVKTVENGYQGALMAPTEILAEQHLFGLQRLLAPLKIRLGLLTGSLTRKTREKLLQDIANGEVDLVVGTHALIQDEVTFRNLGLVVIDEQHRFGVLQRTNLMKKGRYPDVLVMTATPIPRSLALTLYGDLDLSVIDQLPPGRKPVQTYWIGETQRQKVYDLIRQQVALGHQAYIVCPLVEESEQLQAEAATVLAQRLQKEVFPDLKIGLLHGRMVQEEKEKVMNDFKHGLLQILVSTTVIEVGVDVPNATVMLIEGAERFGLAQLHQLRGRVGRGEGQSFCLLMANPRTEEGKQRMRVMTQTQDGFVIAEKDLAIRGPGEFFGTRQSGLPDLKVADILRDYQILEIARTEAEKILQMDPEFCQVELQGLRNALTHQFRESELFNYLG